MAAVAPSAAAALVAAVITSLHGRAHIDANGGESEREALQIQPDLCGNGTPPDNVKGKLHEGLQETPMTSSMRTPPLKGANAVAPKAQLGTQSEPAAVKAPSAGLCAGT